MTRLLLRSFSGAGKPVSPRGLLRLRMLLGFATAAGATMAPDMKGEIRWYIAPAEPAGYIEVLQAIQQTGLTLQHPLLHSPSVLSAEAGREGDAVAVELPKLAGSLAQLKSGQHVAFQLWIDASDRDDVICTARTTEGGLVQLSFSFDGLSPAQQTAAEDRLLTVRRQGLVRTIFWIIDLISKTEQFVEAEQGPFSTG